MEINEFIENFKNQFDDPDTVKLNPDTKFRELEDWNSLTGLMTIAMADEAYGVIVKPEELAKAISVSDIFNLILSKIK